MLGGKFLAVLGMQPEAVRVELARLLEADYVYGPGM